MSNREQINIFHGDKMSSKNDPKQELTIKSDSKSKRFISDDCYLYFEAAAEATRYFLRKTAVHGCHFIVDESDLNQKFSVSRSPRYSRYLAKLSFLTSILFFGGGCLYMMSLMYERYVSTPTVISIETTNYPIYEVPFPTVTFCNINKVYSSNILNLTNQLETYSIDSELVIEFFKSLSALVEPEYLEAQFLKIYVILESIGFDSERLMGFVAQPCGNLLKSCTWLGRSLPCEQLFDWIQTMNGFCCSFNYNGVTNGVLMNYKTVNRTDELLYVLGAGERVGLTVTMDIEPDKYLSATSPFYGVEVFVHNPQEQPTKVMTSLAQVGQDVSISVVPSVIISEMGVRDVPLTQRRCYFEDEKPLRSTHRYSFDSCMMECRVDTIVDLCGCVPFNFPETQIESFIKSRRLCNLRDVSCLRRTSVTYNSLQAPSNSSRTYKNATGMQCECLPNCSESIYTFNTITGHRTRASQQSGPTVFDNKTENFTTVNVYFRELTCTKYRRDIYMTWDSLFSQFGGIFGLCLGGSLLTIVELLYAFTFKLWEYIRTGRSHRTSPIVQLPQPPSYFPQAKVANHATIFNYNKRNPFIFGN